MRTAIFRPYDMTNSETDLHARAGERVEILGPLDLDHEEFTMSRIRFDDGVEGVAFDDDELSDIQNH